MMGETSGSEQTSIGIRDADQLLVSSIQTKRCPTSPFPAGQCCIFEVPAALRKSNEKAYVPNIISIGPYHNGKENLKPMERVKLWYMHCLLNRSPTRETNLDCFVKNIRYMEPYCRECYAEKFSNFNSDQFVEMMIVDGCFIIELFRKLLPRVQRDEDDTLWMSFTLKYDLLLLENQLPWGVLECIWNLTVTQFERYRCTLPGLAVCFFSSVMPMIPEEPKRMFGNKHLLDLLRNILLSSAAPDMVHRETMAMEARKWEPIPCVTELLQAGVKFKLGNKNDLLDIKFNKGEMKIPPILIQENAEYLFRNLVAFEQCDRSCTDKIASYAILLDNLINSTKDVDFLCQEGIIETYFSHEDLASIFFRLCSCTQITYFSYTELSQKVNKYYKARWPRWQAILRRDYFNNPWSILSFFAAILILFFTFAQTLLSVLSYQDSLARP